MTLLGKTEEKYQIKSKKLSIKQKVPPKKLDINHPKLYSLIYSFHKHYNITIIEIFCWIRLSDYSRNQEPYIPVYKLNFIIDTCIANYKDNIPEEKLKNILTRDYYKEILAKRGFLSYDPKTGKYLIKTSCYELGELIKKLYDGTITTSFDRDYYSQIIEDLKYNINSWENSITQLDLSNYLSHETIDLFEKIISKKQQVENYNQIIARIFELNENLNNNIIQFKENIGEFQSKFIMNLHNNEPYHLITSEIDSFIADYNKVIEDFTKESENLRNLFDQNQETIELIRDKTDLIIKKIQNLNFMCESIENSKIRNDILHFSTQILSINQNINNFTSNFIYVNFNIISTKLNLLNNLFSYLNQLLLNTELVGTIYDVWKYGIYNILENLRPHKVLPVPNLNHITPISRFNNLIDNQYLDEFVLDFTKETNELKLKELIRKRNEEMRIKREQISEDIDNKIQLENEEGEIIQDLINHILKSNKQSINIPEEIFNWYEISGKNFSNYNLNHIISSVYILLKDKMTVLPEEETNLHKIFYNLHKIDDEKFLKIKSKKIRLKGEL